MRKCRLEKADGKTLADRFASCENIVWISFKRMYGKYLPPPPPPELDNGVVKICNFVPEASRSF